MFPNLTVIKRTVERRGESRCEGDPKCIDNEEIKAAEVDAGY